jgi:hypothetical protein
LLVIRNETASCMRHCPRHCCCCCCCCC